MELQTVCFLVALCIVAFFYASVGHGGASGYLALMALFSVEPVFMKSSALTLNLFVASMSFYLFFRAGYFRWKLFWPFALASVPAAFIGGNIQLDPAIYKKILAVCLVFAVIRIVWKTGEQSELKSVRVGIALAIGLLLGLFSGLIGIGGGIILSPLILIFGWGNLKETAAVSALFIFVNSAAGLTGHALSGAEFSPEIIVWIAVALTGGTAGAYFGSKRLNFRALKFILAAVLVLASAKLFLV